MKITKLRKGMIQFIVLISVLYPNTYLKSQTCISSFQDLAGFDNSNYLNLIQPNACALMDNIENDFKIFEASLYLHNPKFLEGINHSINNLLTAVEDETGSYILFVRENDINSMPAKVHVFLKLPTTEDFACITNDYPNFAGNLQALVESKLNSELINDVSSYFRSVGEVLLNVSNRITEIRDCCNISFTDDFCTDCLFSENLIVSDLEYKGFSKYQDSIPIFLSGDSNHSSSSLLNLSDYNFTLFDTLDILGLSVVCNNNWSYAGVDDFVLIVTDDNAYCDMAILEQAQLAFDSHAYTLWIHLTLNDLIIRNPTFRFSSSFTHFYYKAQENSQNGGCGPEWEDDDDVPRYKKTKLPYKADDFKSVAESHDPIMYKSYNNGTNSSLGQLQKNAWSNSWDRGFQGTAGEAVLADIYNTTIPASTGIVYFEQTGDFIGAASQSAAAAALTKIIHAPDKFTDVVVLLENTDATSFDIKLYDIKRSIWWTDLHRFLGFPPPFVTKSTSSIGSLVVEVKTTGVKYMYQHLIRGIIQLNDNALSITGMPILAVDEGNLLRTLNSSNLTDEQIDLLEYQLRGPIIKKGGVDGIYNMNCVTISRLQSLIDAIRTHPNQKPPNGYY